MTKQFMSMCCCGITVHWHKLFCHLNSSLNNVLIYYKTFHFVCKRKIRWFYEFLSEISSSLWKLVNFCTIFYVLCQRHPIRSAPIWQIKHRALTSSYSISRHANRSKAKHSLLDRACFLLVDVVYRLFQYHFYGRGIDAAFPVDDANQVAAVRDDGKFTYRKWIAAV